jgi:hypothetical protein
MIDLLICGKAHVALRHGMGKRGAAPSDFSPQGHDEGAPNLPGINHSDTSLR